MFQFGGTIYPLESSPYSLLRDVDPARYAALAFFESVLDTYLGARWSTAATAAGRTDLTSVVAATASVNPEPYLTGAQLTFPLLALYRVDHTPREVNNVAESDESTWQLAYVLPPLGYAVAEQLQPMLTAVYHVLRDRIPRGSDPAYNEGQPVWGDAGLSFIRIAQATYGNFASGSDLMFPALLVTLVVGEQTQTPAGAFDALDQVSVVSDLATEDGEDPAFGVVRVQVPNNSSE